MKQEIQEVADLVTANTIFCTKEVLTSDEAARYIGVSKSCLYKWTMSRQIPHYKSPTGKMCFFNRQEVESWMQTNRIATSSSRAKGHTPPVQKTVVQNRANDDANQQNQNFHAAKV